MKTKLIFSVLLMIGLSTITAAQYGNRHSDRHHTSYRYNDSDRGHYSVYGNYDYYASFMNRQDRKRLRRLVRELEEEKRCAWQNGHVSRRERRRINNVKDDIDRLVSRYRRNGRNTTYRFRSGCR